MRRGRCPGSGATSGALVGSEVEEDILPYGTAVKEPDRALATLPEGPDRASEAYRHPSASPPSVEACD
ncbi:hypothetical protein GCM10009588_01830 [Microbacterium phyllosphaerae]